MRDTVKGGISFNAGNMLCRLLSVYLQKVKKNTTKQQNISSERPTVSWCFQLIIGKSYFSGPFSQWTLKESENVYQTRQCSLLPHCCHGHWLQLSINNSFRSLFSCLQLQDPVPLRCPWDQHTYWLLNIKLMF